MRRAPRRWIAPSLILSGLSFWAVGLYLASLSGQAPEVARTAQDAHAWAFGAAALGNVLIFAGLGQAVLHTPFGILRSGRNTLSLAKLQMTAWTVLIIAALATAAACRAWALGFDAALQINIPPELLQVMGISFVSAAAAPAINAMKVQDPTPDQVQAASIRLGEPLVASGQTVHRPDGARVRLSDLIRGDDLASAGTVDIGKVQQLLITALVITVYAGMVASLFRTTVIGSVRTDLPKFSSDFVTLLLVSHGGYLALKAAPKPDSSAAAGPQRPLPPPDRNAA
jgi:hypothetical protein